MKKRSPQIVAFGGGGFIRTDRDRSLDRYVLSLCHKKNPRVCFIPTASGENIHYIRSFYKKYKKLGCRPSHLSFFSPPKGSLESFLLRHDLIYVGGGNTKSMLALWREWGVDRILKKAWKKGIILYGVSAGMICWFQEGLTDSFTGKLLPLPCLGFLKGSACPHYDKEKMRRPTYRRLLRDRKISNGYAADNCVGLHFVGKKLVKIVSNSRTANAYQVYRKNRWVIEKQLKPEFLG